MESISEEASKKLPKHVVDFGTTKSYNETIKDIEQEDGNWSLSPTQRILSCSLLLVLTIIAFAANLGIVYYEKIVPDTHRTLLNKIAALASLYKLLTALTTFPTVFVRLSMDWGISDSLCRLHNILFMFSLAQLVFSYNELIVLHYIYVCKVGAVGIIKEEIIVQLVIWINLGLGFFLGSVHGMTLHLPGHVYHSFCTNTRLHLAGDTKYKEGTNHYKDHLAR